MDMTATADMMEDARPVDSLVIDPAHVDAVMLQRLLSMFLAGQLPLFLAAFLMGLAVVGIDTKMLMWALIAFQVGIRCMSMLISRLLARSIVGNKRDGRLFAALITTEVLSGAVWGLMMLPVTPILGQGLGPLFVCITLIVTITISVMSNASVRIISWGTIIGFSATLLPQTIYYYDLLGPLPLIATLILLVSLWLMTSVQGKQARNALLNELNNQQLAFNLERALENSEYLASYDSLTGLLNRRAFQQKLENIRSEQPDAGISIILLDLDNFKAVNDNYGHEVGDSVLAATAKLIASVTRGEDMSTRWSEAAARWGGEEFIIALIGCQLDAAVIVSERLRERLAEHTDPDWPEGLYVTGSFGVANWYSGKELMTGINQADKAMYQAKNSGRNLVETASA